MVRDANLEHANSCAHDSEPGGTTPHVPCRLSALAPGGPRGPPSSRRPLDPDTGPGSCGLGLCSIVSPIRRTQAVFVRTSPTLRRRVDRSSPSETSNAYRTAVHGSFSGYPGRRSDRGAPDKMRSGVQMLVRAGIHLRIYGICVMHTAEWISAVGRPKKGAVWLLHATVQGRRGCLADRDHRCEYP